MPWKTAALAFASTGGAANDFNDDYGQHDPPPWPTRAASASSHACSPRPRYSPALHWAYCDVREDSTVANSFPRSKLGEQEFSTPASPPAQMTQDTAI